MPVLLNALPHQLIANVIGKLTRLDVVREWAFLRTVASEFFEPSCTSDHHVPRYENSSTARLCIQEAAQAKHGDERRWVCLCEWACVRVGGCRSVG